MTHLELKEIKKRYENFSLQSMDLTVQEGEIFALLGPSGCGKTTLLKLIAGLMKPDQGDLYYNGQRITTISAEKRGFGMVFQQALLFPHMNVEENVAFGLKMQGVPKEDRFKKANEMLSHVGLEGFGKRHPSELSGGQQQRVSLARALVFNSRLLLMDEPFSALDPEIREEMRELLLQIHQKHKVTVIFVTHDREEAYILANRVGIMKDGVLLQVGKPKELYENPCHPEVACFLGAKNVWKGILQEGQFITDHLQLPLYHSKERFPQSGWLVIRPEVLRVVSSREDRVQEGSIQGMIQNVSFRQGFYHLKVSISPEMLDVIHQVEPDFHPNPGDLVTLTYDVRKIRFIPDSMGERG